MLRSNSFSPDPRPPLQHLCAVCDSRVNLLRCASCHLVRYCSQEHQVEHWLPHKKLCKRIGKLKGTLHHEEDLIRNATPNFMTPANAFETSVGHFWGIVSTRDYMCARYAVANEAQLSGTLDGMQQCLQHFQEMLRLNRGDKNGPLPQDAGFDASSWPGPGVLRLH